MLDKLNSVEKRYSELAANLADPSVQADPGEYRKQAKALSEIEPLVEKYREYKAVQEEIAQAQELVKGSDADMRALAQEELGSLESRREALERELKILLVPRDPNDEKNVLLEIRAGTGGDEAALFAADLYRMYTRFCERQGWRVETMSYSDGTLGGIREVIFKVSGSGAYGSMRWESGVHRVQRVPRTESQGRIHTSAATVAVLPEAEAVDVKIEDKDIRIDVFRSSGPGGQSVNTTDSAVRITHLPTGLVVSQQDQKSQLQNKLKAMEVLRARLLGLRIQQQQDERAKMRRSQVGGGDRSEKIRTYNYPQSRVTDHRVDWTTHNLQGFVDGDIGDLIEALKLADVEEQLGADV